MKYSKLIAHLGAAESYAKLSKANRLKVGVVIVKDDRPIAVGINGTPSGYDNSCEETIPHVNMLDQITTIEYKTRPEVIHAEANAIAFAAKNGVSTNGCIMVLTHSPCYECSKLIIQSGIKEVYYKEEYRIIDSLRFLEDNNVKVNKIGEKDGEY